MGQVISRKSTVEKPSQSVVNDSTPGKTPVVKNDEKSNKNATIYKCTHCQQPFFSLPEVQNHRCVKEAQKNNQNGGKNNNSTKEKSSNETKNEVTIYKCSLCEKPFLTLPEVRNHDCTKEAKNSPKNGQNPQNGKKDVTIYKCSLCQNPFLTIQEARDHDCPKANSKKPTTKSEPTKTAEKPKTQVGVSIKKPIQSVKKPAAPTEDVVFVDVDEPFNDNTKTSQKPVQNPKTTSQKPVRNPKTSTSPKVSGEKPKQSGEQTMVFVDVAEPFHHNNSRQNSPKPVEKAKTSTTPKVLYGKLKPKPVEPVDMTADYMSALNEDATFDFAEGNSEDNAKPVDNPMTSTTPQVTDNKTNDTESVQNYTAEDISTALNQEFLFDFVDCSDEMIGIDEEDKIAVDNTDNQKNADSGTKVIDKSGDKNETAVKTATEVNNGQKEVLKVNSRVEATKKPIQMSEGKNSYLPRRNFVHDMDHFDTQSED